MGNAGGIGSRCRRHQVAILGGIKRGKYSILQRGTAEGGAGLDEPDAVPEEPGTGGVAGPKKCPHPPTNANRRVREICEKSPDSGVIPAHNSYSAMYGESLRRLSQRGPPLRPHPKPAKLGRPMEVDEPGGVVADKHQACSEHGKTRPAAVEILLALKDVPVVDART